VLDMEAGLEHLGRGTAMAVDRLIVVVEPGRRSVETAYHIKQLAKDIGVKTLALVGNKVRSDKDESFFCLKCLTLSSLGSFPLIAPSSKRISKAVRPSRKTLKGSARCKR